MSLSPEQRSSLLAASLRALVGARWGLPADAESSAFPDGAVLIDRAGARVWILIEDHAAGRLGAALAIARRAEATELHLLIADDTAGATASDGIVDAAGVLARRAALFATPARVWRVEGRELVEVAASPPAPDLAPHPLAEAYRPVLAAAGLTPVVEDGVLTGELLGLEVARVVVDDDGQARLEAGVGRFDREVGAMMFADLGEVDAVARAVDIVAGYRQVGAPRHPLNQLVPERWLRATIVDDPSLAGAAALVAVGSAVPRRNLTEIGAATAVGTDVHGRDLVVVCSTGVHLDLVPTAADDRLTHAPGARLVLVVPEVDAVALTRDLADRLADPAEIITVGPHWQDPTNPDA